MELAKITASLGLRPTAGCQCRARAAQMDEWGVAGCLLHFDEIVDWIREAYASATWLAASRARFSAALSGLAWELDWSDPLPDLVTLAIRRAHAKADRPRFVTLEDRAAALRKLVSKIPGNVSGIVGVSRSGLAPAGDVASLLHLPMYSQGHDDVVYCGNGWRLNDGKPLPGGLLGPLRGDGPVLVVDDTLMTGGSLQRSRFIVPEFFPGRDILYSCVFRNPGKHVPDLWGEDLPGLHFLEWNLFNSCHLPRLGVDFDGILTIDGTNDPQFLVRKQPIRLIATGRHESSRAGTEEWLKKWGVKCEKMAMWNGGRDIADLFAVVRYKGHDVLAVSKHKAEALLSDKRLFYFAESCPIQAEQIAALTGAMVCCPAAKKVF